MSNVQVQITLQDSRLEDKQLQAEVMNLLQQIKRNVEVEYAEPVAVEEVPEESKAWGGFLLGVLTAEVNGENFKKLVKFLASHIVGETMKMEVKKANGEKFKGKASSLEELKEMMKMAQEFIDS